MKVLVTGGSIGDFPIIEYLKDAGHYVITSGNLPNDISHSNADEYIPADYTDDEYLAQICVEKSIEALIPSSHDLAAISAAKVAQKLNLPGYDSPEISEMIHTKNTLRDSMKKIGLKVPQYIYSSSEFEIREKMKELKFPVIVKPVDLTGGNGVSICNSPTDLIKAFEVAFEKSPSKKVIVEQFLVGSYHGLTTILNKGKVEFYFVDNEQYRYGNFRVSSTTHPSSLSSEKVSDVLREIEAFVHNYQLVDGILHTQLVNTKDGVYILEICRRTPGDLYPFFVKLSTGVNYSELISYPFLGYPIEKAAIQKVNSFRNVVRLMVLPDKRGTFAGFSNNFSESPIYKFFPRTKGDFISSPTKTTVAILFYGSDTVDYSNSLDNIYSEIKVIIDE